MRDARCPAQRVDQPSILRLDNHGQGGSGMSQYEMIGIGFGVVIFGIILLAGVVVGRREHA